MMRVAYTRPTHLHPPTMLTQMKDGWSYVSTYVPVRNLLLLFCICSLTGMPYIVLMPVFATQVLHGNAHTLGFLTAASGTGALISAVSLAMRKSVVGLVRMIQIAVVLFGAGLMVFGMSHWLWLSLAAMLTTGFGMIQALSACNTVIQTLAPDEKRGRVMSYYTLAYVGMMPFGSLLIGVIAHWIGAPDTLMAMGGCVLLAGLAFFSQRGNLKTAMRPRYEELGILKPKIATGAD
jgi:MFS family permease